MSFFDQLARVTRFKLVHARWRRQRMEVLPGVVPVSLLLARTEDTVVGLTDVRGYPDGFVFLLRVRWGHVADPFEEVPWPFPGWGSPDPLDGEPFPDELLRFGVQFADGRKVTNTATILYVGMPHRGRVPGWWVGPVLQLLLLGVLIAQDPGRIDRRSATGLSRLSVSGVHQRHRVQPHRYLAGQAVGQADHDGPVDPVAGDRDPGAGPGHQHPAGMRR